MVKPPAAGAIAHVELVSLDLAKSVEFYERVFGWKFEDVGGGYMFTSPPAAPTGAIRGPQEHERGGSLSYIEVRDLPKVLKAATAAGAKVLVPSTEIPNMGRYAVLLAPGNVAQGIFQSG